MSRSAPSMFWFLAAVSMAWFQWRELDAGKEKEKAELLEKQREASSSGALLGRWNQAIDTAAKNQNIEGAERLIAKIREAGLAPDSVSYNSVMHGCALVGDPQRAEYWYQQMKREGIKANSITYNIMINAHAKNGDPVGRRMPSSACLTMALRPPWSPMRRSS